MSRAYVLLRQRRGDFRRIAEECDVSYSWLSKVSQGQLGDAVAGRLERVVDHLEGLPQPPSEPVNQLTDR